LSIATLKRKTQTKYNNMSVGEKQFSLNGSHRNQGFVGQTSLSRSLPRTLMKGNTLRGHGGCCGTYFITPIVQSAVKTTEDSSIVKSSVINTQGMIDTKYRWIRRPQPFSSTKPDNNSNTNTQEQYIEKLAKRTINESLEECDTIHTSTCCNIPRAGKPKVFNFTKPLSSYVPISSGEYTRNIVLPCEQNDEVSIRTTNLSVLPGNGRRY
jgi:hypothetical protein